MENTYFQFNNVYYKQIFGTPMGSPVSLIFADIVMPDLERDCLSKLDFKPLFYYRYVDDIITCIPRSKVQNMLDTFNSFHPRLQFTSELEKDRSISFLDVLLIRDNNKIISNWYRKPTFSGRFLNFNSSHPTSHKRGMVFNLVDRAVSLSDKRFHNQNLNFIKSLLRDNGYPDSFFNRLISSRLHYLKEKSLSKDPNLITITLTDPEGFTSVLINRRSASRLDPRLKLRPLALPYIRGFSERFSSTLRRHNIRSVPLVNTNLSGLVIKGKDKVDKFSQTGVVYKISCKACEAFHVGETKRELPCPN